MAEVVSSPATAPTSFHVMVKPRGPICNLDCKYCYFLQKESMAPKGDKFRMGDDLLENYIRQYIEAQQTQEVSLAWQGGEPTLMGLDFFKRVVELEKKYQKPNTRIANALQTNGVLLNDEWCEFFKANDFLIGISIDGPKELHDAYRVDKGGKPTFDKVMHGLNFLKKHGVEFNVLTTVHAANGNHPKEVYTFLRDVAETTFMQFIPIVERDNETGYQEGHKVTPRSVTARQYGEFLMGIFDEWIKRDVGQRYVQIFDEALGAWSGYEPSLCIFRETCGNALALGHDGDLFSCDHFVEPNYKLGNIQEKTLQEMVSSEEQRRFGQDKKDTLPRYCRECEVRFMCNGGCPKNRIIKTPDGEEGLNYLCAGYKAFFNYIDVPMRFMANELRHRRAPANVMAFWAQREASLQEAFSKASRNDVCPCGSKQKFKHCHGR